jgi:predicted outer membrane repeat protein
VEINRATFNNNTAQGRGSGILNAGQGMIMIANSAILSNTTGDDGGGITNLATMDLTNTTISGNNATTSGGGINNTNTITLTYVTISNNTADNGGGIASSGNTLLQNTLVAMNTSGGDCDGEIVSRGYNLDSDGTCTLNESTDLSSIDPLIGPAASNGGATLTHALLEDSPAIDTGLCTTISTDQRGEPRPGTGSTACDIGAFEAQDVTPTPTPTPEREAVYLPFIAR